MNTPLGISKDIKIAINQLRDFSESDCHAEDLADCLGYCKSRLDDLDKIKKNIQAMLIERGYLTESGDTVESDTFKILLTLRSGSTTIDRKKLESDWPLAWADVATHKRKKIPVITSKSVA